MNLAQRVLLDPKPRPSFSSLRSVRCEPPRSMAAGVSVSLQFRFAPITWASITTSTPARSKSQVAGTPCRLDLRDARPIPGDRLRRASIVRCPISEHAASADNPDCLELPRYGNVYRYGDIRH